MAATDLERLVVQLSADIKKYENALSRAMGQTNKQARQIEARFAKMNKNITTGFSALSQKMVGAFAVAGGIKGLQTLLDSATRIDNALKVAGLSGAELEKVYDRLRDSAVKNAAPLETMVELYGRLKLVQGELNVSGAQLEGFVDRIGVALRINGKSAAETSGALTQLSQALGAGTVRAEEFSSILEGALPIAQAAAAGLKEAGGSVAKLRQLVVDGKVSSEAFFRAFEAGSVILEDKVAGATLTTSQALENVHTALINAMRDFAKGSLAAKDLGDAFQIMADRINAADFQAFGEEVRTAIKWISQLKNALSFTENLGANFGAATGLDQFGVWLSEKTGLDIATDRAKERKGYWEKLAEEDIKARNEAYAEVFKDPTKYGPQLPKTANFQVPFDPLTGLPSALKSPVKQVSIEEYAAASSGKKGRKGSKRADDYARETEQIRERTAALNAETAAQAGINPLIDDYGFAIEKARAKQELLTAAQNAGKEVTPELAKEIETLAGAYATATVASEQLAEKQDEIRERADEALATAKDVVSGMVDGFMEGEKAADIFANSLKKIGRALVDDVLSNVFKIQKAGSGGGLFGGGGGFFSSLLGMFSPQWQLASSGGIGLYDKGGYTGGGGKYEPAGVVHKGEYVFDQEAVRRAGGPAALDAVRRALKGYANGGYVGASIPAKLPSASPGISIDARTTFQASGNAQTDGEMMRALARRDAELPGLIIKTVREAQKRRGL
ncbi:tape measure protein [Shinella zoogloeoides]|uniref:tape measure protein n=1 Tax=Shinella zoogloeoides TaxID=352475 RepID=UPI00273D60ED|nr:tape measure protein [Shinella zoogloeoides]WLR94247.1 tape measure protein [Shinella zoogloeoides]